MKADEFRGWCLCFESGFRDRTLLIGFLGATETRKHTPSCHLVELHQQDHAGPAGVVKGQQEDAEHPGRAADQGRDHAPQALLLIMQHTMS